MHSTGLRLRFAVPQLRSGEARADKEEAAQTANSDLQLRGHRKEVPCSYVPKPSLTSILEGQKHSNSLFCPPFEICSASAPER